MEDSRGSGCPDSLPPCGRAAKTDHCNQERHAGSSGGGTLPMFITAIIHNKPWGIFSDNLIHTFKALTVLLFSVCRSTCLTSPTLWSKVLSCSCPSRPVWRWRSLEISSWRPQSLRWCCSISMTTGWRPSRLTQWVSLSPTGASGSDQIVLNSYSVYLSWVKLISQQNLFLFDDIAFSPCVNSLHLVLCSIFRPSPDWSSSSEPSMSTMTAPRWFWNPTRQLSQSPTTSGPRSLTRSGSRWRCSWKTSSWQIMAKRTSRC